MTLKINKACDLSSISVLPPPARRSNGVSNGPETSCSIFGRRQAAFSQIRSQQQQSQQSSQGVSSEHGTFSQLSQNNSFDEIAMNDQRFGSQERENSRKRLSCLAPINNTPEDSQIQVSRSSTNLVRKWNSAAPEYRCQSNEELEPRIGMMATSISRFGMILDSVQSDVMQVNKGTKELAMEMESVRQKLNVIENSLQLMNKGQEDLKTSIEGGMNLISDKFSQNVYQESLQEIFSLVSALPEMIEVCVQKLQSDLSKSFKKEMQAMACSLKISNQKQAPTVHPPKAISNHVIAQERPGFKFQAVQPKVQQATAAPKIEMETWNSVKCEKVTFRDRVSNKGHKLKGVSPIGLERDLRVTVESDEEIDGGFCCLLEETETEETGKFSIQEAREETERILRKARRRKRKFSNTIIIN